MPADHASRTGSPAPRRYFPRSRPTALDAAAALAVVALTLVVMGCMSISIGKFAGCAADREDPFSQEGECRLTSTERNIYYPVPFAHPPNLEISGCSGQYELLEQREDHFRILCPGLLPQTVTWKAKGVRAPRAVPVTTTVTPAPIPPPATPPIVPPPVSDAAATPG